MIKSERSKTVKQVISVAIIVIAAAVGSAFGGEVYQYLSNLSSGDISDKILSEEADKMNRNLPMMVDSQTQLSNVHGAKNTFHYNYTLINVSTENIDKAIFDSQLTDRIRNNYCTNPDMKAFRQHGVTLQYNYSDKDGKFVTEISVHPDECSKSPEG